MEKKIQKGRYIKRKSLKKNQRKKKKKKKQLGLEKDKN